MSVFVVPSSRIPLVTELTLWNELPLDPALKAVTRLRAPIV